MRPGTYGKVVLCDAPGSPGGASATYCLKIIPLYPNTSKRKCVPALCVLARTLPCSDLTTSARSKEINQSMMVE